jgi:hypothetical protein
VVARYFVIRWPLVASGSSFHRRGVFYLLNLSYVNINYTVFSG